MNIGTVKHFPVAGGDVGRLTSHKLDAGEIHLSVGIALGIVLLRHIPLITVGAR
jgi:hypothetical protein